MENAAFYFILPLTEQMFLADKELQDKMFNEHVQGLKNQIERLSVKHNFLTEGFYKETAYTLSGTIAASHLTGPQSLINLLTNKVNISKDGLGTDTTEYLFKFSYYQIP
jgi:hypothetical protein